MPTTLQPETLAFLPIALLIRIGAKPFGEKRFGEKRSSWVDALVVGAMAGILFTLKYPFVLAAIPVAWMVVRRSENIAKSITFITMGFVAVVGVAFGIVWYDGIVAAMQQIAVFLTGYASTHESIKHLLLWALACFADYFANDSSTLLTTLALTGVIAGMMRAGKHDPLFVVTVSILVVLGFSVIVERKFNLVHMVRVIPAMAIMVGYGAPIVWLALKRSWRKRLFSVPVFVAMAVIILLLSPLPRIMRSVEAFGTVVAHNMPFAKDRTHHAGIVDRFGMEPLIAAVANAHPRSVVVLGLGGTLLYWHLPQQSMHLVPRAEHLVPQGEHLPGLRKSKFADSHFFTSSYAPPAWQAEALIEAREADVIVLQDDDSHPRLSGHLETTKAALIRRAAWAELFAERRVVFDDGNMSVWTRR
mgnify:CR=1 FL=1